MIDHKVMIGDEDVSSDVINIKIEDQIETDSDPGKITILLANRQQKYTTKFTPQRTVITVFFYNFVYRTEAERRIAGGHSQVEYMAFTGRVTDVSANHSEATIGGECDLGHLADALPREYDGYNKKASQVLQEVLNMHVGAAIPLHVQILAKNDLFFERKTYTSEQTFLDVLEDIRQDTGSVYYFSEDGVLQFRDPAAIHGHFDLDPYVLNPDQTSSIMGFCNIVKVIGDRGLNVPGIHDRALSISAPESIQYTARDDEAQRNERVEAKANAIAEKAKKGDAYSISLLGLKSMFTQAQLDEAIKKYIAENGGPGSVEEVGPLVAATERAYNLKTYEQVKARAEQLLEFYKMRKNALTQVQVAGIVPILQSQVSYTPFALIDGDDISPISAVVVARKIEYSIEGLICDLTLSPGMMDYETYVGDEEIEEFTLSFGSED